MSSANASPKAGVKSFSLEVLPDRDHLETALSENGQCNPTDCWHYVAITALMDALAPGEKHNVKVDAGHIRLNYRGWRYVADTPRHVKRSLMLFDLGRYDEVRIKCYKLRFRRTTRIMPVSDARKAYMRDKQRARRAVGNRKNDRTLRARVEGFSGLV
jgi:hypothetical protein